MALRTMVFAAARRGPRMSWRRSELRTRFSPDGERAPVHLRGVLAKGMQPLRDVGRAGVDRAPGARPDNYWPAVDATASREQFDETIASFHRDRAALRDIVADPATDLFAVIPGTPGHTIFREIRVVGAHNAYHVGEFAILRQVMGT